LTTKDQEAKIFERTTETTRTQKCGQIPGSSILEIASY
jgi:hypothetical protein